MVGFGFALCTFFRVLPRQKVLIVKPDFDGPSLRILDFDTHTAKSQCYDPVSCFAGYFDSRFSFPWFISPEALNFHTVLIFIISYMDRE